VAGVRRAWVGRQPTADCSWSCFLVPFQLIGAQWAQRCGKPVLQVLLFLFLAKNVGTALGGEEMGEDGGAGRRVSLLLDLLDVLLHGRL